MLFTASRTLLNLIAACIKNHNTANKYPINIKTKNALSIAKATNVNNIIEKAKNQGYVRTLFNRKRNIPELNNTVYTIRQSGERMALNTPVQGTSADIIKLAMVKVFNAISEANLKSKMIMQVHDELIFDVVKEEVESLTKIVKEVMENVYQLEVPLKVDINYGENWYDAK